MSDTPSYVKNLKQESVVQSVINCLTDALRSKELRPGDKLLPEPELAASMGVARSSVREAIKILTYLGVLESKRSEGTFVCGGFRESMIDPMVYGIILGQDSADDLMELREITEAGMLRFAALRRTEEDLAALRALLEQMRASLRKEDAVERFFAADNAFHDYLSKTGKNPLADKIGRVVRTLTHAMRYETVSAMLRAGRSEELLDAHWALYRAVERQEPDGLEELVRKGYFTEALEHMEYNKTT